MKLLYFDPIGGASVDMILAALIDLGVKRDHLRKALSFVPGSELKVGRVTRQGVNACKVSFTIRKKIREKQFIPLIKKSKLPSRIKDQAIDIIERIFAVEKRVHRTEHLHLHELADADTLLDIVGVLVGLDVLKVDKVYSRPVKAGAGFVKTIEGNMPAFNFATALLLKKFPVHFVPTSAELTTPTGAAILSSIATPREDLFVSKINGIGLGAGSRDIKDHPNILRVFLGESYDHLTDECTVIQTNIDDMNPQDFEMLFEKLYAAGALDVFLTPTIMKRSRPGIHLTVLCQKNLDYVVDVLFAHTTSIGFRLDNVRRLKFQRRMRRIASPYGNVRVKIIEYDGRTKYSVEYRDLKRIAEQTGDSVSKIRNRIMQLIGRKRGY
ncbi:MAG: nickel pincer cofactor biosynthesis protein LarC [candidate division WOR-3 bacterium]|nr:MAG: nickel pincer cofactor biosynthesis protein LarC [candidate division WOR-3 bacterium]